MLKKTNATITKSVLPSTTKQPKRPETNYSRNSAGANFFGAKVSYMIGSSVKKAVNRYGE